jgi:hypothetical protein
MAQFRINETREAILSDKKNRSNSKDLRISRIEMP